MDEKSPSNPVFSLDKIDEDIGGHWKVFVQSNDKIDGKMN